MAFLVYAMFICIHYKFSSVVIFLVVLFVASLVWFSLPVPLVSDIRLVSIFVSFALPLSCILHVRSLLVILCSLPCLSFVIFSYRVHSMFGLFGFE